MLRAQHDHDRDPQQERILELVNRRLDQLDTAATPAVAGILTAAERLPAADRIYVKRRLTALGAPEHRLGQCAPMTGDHLSAKTRRRLARSPYAPIEGDDVLRTPVLAQLLLHRLVTLGPMPEGAAVLLLESRAPGRADETIAWAKARGMLTRTPPTDDEPAMIEAVGSPRSLAA